MSGVPSGELISPASLAEVLGRVRAHLTRYIRTMDPRDITLLTLWAAHTHTLADSFTSPRLIIDSLMPQSGKTTVLEHFERLCRDPVLAVGLKDTTISRMFTDGPRTLLLDEVDRQLDPKQPNTELIISIVNVGYKRGAKRPVTVMKGNVGEIVEMPLYGAVAMAGNTPNLADDTRSRAMRILMLPDLDGSVEWSDWEEIEADVIALGQDLAQVLAAESENVRAAKSAALPSGCTMRAAERWRPLFRIAVAAGPDWEESCRELITRDLAEAQAENEDGTQSQRPHLTLLIDLAGAWPEGRDHWPSSEIVRALMESNPEYWGELSAYGRSLTTKRLGNLLAKMKVHSFKNGQQQRGYSRAQLSPLWLAIPQLREPNPFDNPEPF